MDYDKNFYYHPEESGLTIVATIDDGGSYEFDMVVVWKDEKGNFYWQEDSGCSCPTPFEDFDTLASLNRLTKENFEHFETQVKNHEYYQLSKDDIWSFLRKVRSELYGNV